MDERWARIIHERAGAVANFRQLIAICGAETGVVWGVAPGLNERAMIESFSHPWGFP
jgi:hypothetical protein